MEITPEASSSRSGTLMLHLLGKCNLTCRHCYMDGSPLRREQLATQAVLDAVASTSRIDVGSLYLTGGEPLLYPELHRVLEASAAVPGLDVTVCTNATLITQRHVYALKYAQAKTSISVDGVAEFHDRFRNLNGAFQATEKGIRMLREAGVPVTIVHTVSRANLDTVPWLVEWAHEVGATQVRIQPLLRLGRAIDIVDQCLSPMQVERLVMRLSDLANLYRGRGVRVSIIGQNRAFIAQHPCGAYVCNGGGCHRRVAKEIKKIVVREDGTVFPEATNLDRSYAIGQFDAAPLSDMIGGYFDNGGYDAFDHLCRTTYQEVLPAWKCIVVPWDQILAERSKAMPAGVVRETASAVASCAAC